MDGIFEWLFLCVSGLLHACVVIAIGVLAQTDIIAIVTVEAGR